MDAVAPDSLSDAITRQFLAERDVRCLSCDYSLRGLASARCPECGTVYELALVAQDRPRRQAWSVEKTLRVARPGHTVSAATWGVTVALAGAVSLWAVAAIFGLAAAIPLVARLRLAGGWGRRRIERMTPEDRALMGESAWLWAAAGLLVALMALLGAAASVR